MQTHHDTLFPLPTETTTITATPANTDRTAGSFKAGLRELNRQRLSHEISHPEFLHRLYALHFAHGKRGFDLATYQAELHAWERREAKRRRRAEQRPTTPQRPLWQRAG